MEKRTDAGFVAGNDDHIGALNGGELGDLEADAPAPSRHDDILALELREEVLGLEETHGGGDSGKNGNSAGDTNRNVGEHDHNDRENHRAGENDLLGTPSGCDLTDLTTPDVRCRGGVSHTTE